MDAVAVSPRVKERVAGTLFAAAWMWPLIQPTVAVVQGKVSHPVLGGAGMLAFVVIYLIVVPNGFDDRWERASRTDLVLLWLLALVGFTLLVAYGHTKYGWENVFLYISVGGACVLSSKMTPVWVLGSLGALVLYTIAFPSSHFPGYAVAETAFAVVLASVLVHTVKQLMRYVRILRATRSRLARTAVDEERLRFARDLHDLLGHTLSVIVVKAELVRRLAERDPQAAARAAGDIETIGRQALAEVRDAVDGYRPPQFDTELPRISAALQDAGITVSVVRDGVPSPLPALAGAVLGWVVREATTNVIRHSGARACEVRLDTVDGSARLTVTDDGPDAGRTSSVRLSRASRPEGVGAGLVGLRERLLAVGGTLDAAPRPGGGFRLVATVPLELPDALPGRSERDGVIPAEDGDGSAPFGVRTPVDCDELVTRQPVALGGSGEVA